MSEAAAENAAAAAAPAGYLAKLETAIASRFGEQVTKDESLISELCFEIVSADALLGVMQALRDEPAFRFEICIDVCGVDYLQYGRAEWKTEQATRSGYSRGVNRLTSGSADARDSHRRFAVVYHLLSVSLNQRLRLRVFCADPDMPTIDSVTSIWASADWFEREAFDLFGIFFEGHADLRRILTDYGFVGHPFRKDFPLSGNVEVRYDPEKQRVVYQPVSIEPRTLVPKVIRHDNRYDDVLKDRGPHP